MTSIKFYTNIDCCKKLIDRLNWGLHLDLICPNVDDLVLVCHNPTTEIWLKVVRRKWNLSKDGFPILFCELYLPEYFPTISDLENFMKRNLL